MELWVNYGETVEELKAYALYSLLRDEKACAHKYFNLLKSTVAYRSWAKEMESYIGNRKALYAKYPLYQQIVDEQFPQNFYFTWDNLTEVYKESKVYRKEHVKTLLLLELYDQDLDRFVQDLWNMRRFVDLPLPRCFQEAVVLYSANTGHNLLKDIPVDKTVFDETCQLIQKVQTYPTADGAAKALQKEYQGNCAFYLMCTNLRLPKTEK